jgi:pyruvate dehydrogenase (quinone)
VPSAWNAGRSLGCRNVEVPVHRRELAMPTISLEQINGFGIFMIKAVLSGRGDEIVDLARTNLWR